MSPTEQSMKASSEAQNIDAEPPCASAPAASTEANKDEPDGLPEQSMRAENSSSAHQEEDSSAQHGASSNGVQEGRLPHLAGLSLADIDSTGPNIQQEQEHSTEAGSQPHRPSSPGSEGQYHAELNSDASAALPGEAAEAAEHAAPEEAAVAERAEHAAAAIAAEGLELDRSSEPAAIAAARSGSLAPGLGPSSEHPYNLLSKKDHHDMSLCLCMIPAYGSACTTASKTADDGKAKQMLLPQEMVRSTEGRAWTPDGQSS